MACSGLLFLKRKPGICGLHPQICQQIRITETRTPPTNMATERGSLQNTGAMLVGGRVIDLTVCLVVSSSTKACRAA